MGTTSNAVNLHLKGGCFADLGALFERDFGPINNRCVTHTFLVVWDNTNSGDLTSIDPRMYK